MKFLSAADFDDAITAASKIRAATSYVMLAVGVANSAYSNGAFEAYTPPGAYAAGARPGIGFHASGSFGAYLYAEAASDLRLRTDTGLDYTLWHSDNSRSDAQNDTRYSQLGHTHAISEVTGLQAALDAKTGGSGTPGRYAKFATNTTFADSLLSESGISITANGGVFVSDVAHNSNVRGYGLWASGFARWSMGKAGTESGSDSGSDFVLWAYNDGGTFLREPLRISRASGNATFSGTIAVSGGNSTQWNSAFGWGNHAGLYVPVSRTVSAGTGLTGGGALSANISLAFDTTYGDGRYAALSHTHTIANVTGLQAALDAKVAGSATAGRLPKMATATTITDSLLSESGISITANGGIFVSDTPTNSNVRGYTILNGGQTRWSFGKAGTESGSDSGSDFTLWSFNDAAAFLREPLRISRATGNATFSGTITASGGNSTNWNTAVSWGNHATAGYVPSVRTLSINGTTFDLSANRSWTVSGGLTGSGSTGYLVKWNAGNLDQASIEETSTSLDLKKGANIAKNGTNQYLEIGASSNSIGLTFYNPTSTNSYSMYRFNDTFTFKSVSGANIFNINGDNYLTFVNPTGAQPFKVNSTTRVDNLNVQYLNGNADTYFTPAGRTITINGTTFDLSANRTWTIAAGIGGSATTGRLPKMATGTTLTDSLLSESGIGIIANGGVFVSDVAHNSNVRGYSLWASGLNRWVFGKAGTESGSDSGSDFVLWSYNDAGTFVREPFRVSRATGNVTFTGTVSAGSFAVGANTSAQWTQAYTWGNHAAAGYVTLSYLSTNYYDKAAVNSMVAGYVPDSRQVLGAGSIQGGGNLGVNRTFNLYGDQDNPGANKYYGTDGSGGKGWYSLPSGGGGITGSGSTSQFTKWSGSSSVTGVEMFESGNWIIVGSAGTRRDLIIQGSLVPKQMSASERASYSPGFIGAIVYQTDGTEGLWVTKDNGSGGYTWVYVG
ncbi:hypothetical protein J2Y45_002115 [Dyadobacter sp. BE34]|uniref:Uncharacterized protein n=1 Tax=Dyadobacter fermentans TaxID=94254 RepID=A0ABU1QWS2_9BACT|nr:MULTISPECIES: hypothetical protein [Dyadobacter]MDR6805576.1 hypothetical protein [Dyadobacter fermentans]MDR7042664.1 hypothetical protein [Dyadobacter sp. BE242]MDR7196976.1 hypothetical protein [Dyadobacter sp. BE34]MDR7215589.1 hypothetical protein [Dyadobacter sp. BE31]MDR7263125.1 hypothetical protein [Dyadobacter sp. BE32]